MVIPPVPGSRVPSRGQVFLYQRSHRASGGIEDDQTNRAGIGQIEGDRKPRVKGIRYVRVQCQIGDRGTRRNICHGGRRPRRTFVAGVIDGRAPVKPAEGIRRSVQPRIVGNFKN